MISEGFELIKLPYLVYVFGQTGLTNYVDPDQTPHSDQGRIQRGSGVGWGSVEFQNNVVASDLDLHSLPFTQQLYAHSHVVKWTC